MAEQQQQQSSEPAVQANHTQRQRYHSPSLSQGNPPFNDPASERGNSYPHPSPSISPPSTSANVYIPPAAVALPLPAIPTDPSLGPSSPANHNSGPGVSTGQHYSFQQQQQQAAAKQGLKQWWGKFTKQQQQAGGAAGQLQYQPGSKYTTGQSNGQGVFGIPLTESLKYAGVAISMVGPDGVSQVYGYIPIVVAKCGLFLKQKATTVEGVFRISGSTRRMKELQDIFDRPPSYGKDLVWGPWSVHDAASVLRRYLNQMPEPLVPAELYDEFRNALPPLDKVNDPNAIQESVDRYKNLIASLPSSSKYLLCYILDLLNVFARNHETNLMPASNLAVVFQPGLIRGHEGANTLGPAGLQLPNESSGQTPLSSSPNTSTYISSSYPEQMAKSNSTTDNNASASSSFVTNNANNLELQRRQDEIKINQEVLEFLIHHQDHFVILPLPPQQPPYQQRLQPPNVLGGHSSSEPSPVSPVSHDSFVRAASRSGSGSSAGGPMPVRPQSQVPSLPLSQQQAKQQNPPPPQRQQHQPQAQAQPQVTSPTKPVPIRMGPPSAPHPPVPSDQNVQAQSPPQRIVPQAGPTRSSPRPITKSSQSSTNPQSVPRPISTRPKSASIPSSTLASTPFPATTTPVPSIKSTKEKKPKSEKDKTSDRDLRKPRKLKKGRTPPRSRTTSPMEPNQPPTWEHDRPLPIPKASFSSANTYDDASTDDDNTALGAAHATRGLSGPPTSAPNPAPGSNGAAALRRSRTLPSGSQRNSASPRSVSSRRQSGARGITAASPPVTPNANTQAHNEQNSKPASLLATALSQDIANGDKSDSQPAFHPLYRAASDDYPSVTEEVSMQYRAPAPVDLESEYSEMEDGYDSTQNTPSKQRRKKGWRSAFRRDRDDDRKDTDYMSTTSTSTRAESPHPRPGTKGTNTGATTQQSGLNVAAFPLLTTTDELSKPSAPTSKPNKPDVLQQIQQTKSNPIPIPAVGRKLSLPTDSSPASGTGGTFSTSPDASNAASGARRPSTLARSPPSIASHRLASGSPNASSNSQAVHKVKNPPIVPQDGSGSMSKREARKVADEQAEKSRIAIRDAVNNVGR